MNKSRQIGAIVAVATTAVGVASLVASAPATAAGAGGPQPVSSWLRPVPAHASSWVDIYWRTGKTVCDVEVRVSGAWVNVDYDGNRRFAAFNRGSMLRPGQTDYTAVRVNPDFDRAGTASLRAIISYDSCGFHARTQSSSFPLTLPVLQNNTWPGHSLPGAPGNGHGGPGNSGAGNGGAGNGGPGNGGPGNGGHGDGGQSTNPGGPHHGKPPTNGPSPTITAPSPTTTTPAPAITPAATPTTPAPTTAAPGTGHGHGDGNGTGSGTGNGGSGNGGSGGHSHGTGGQGRPTVGAVHG